MAAEKKEEVQKVKFLQMHPLFAHQEGDEVELRKSAIEEHKLIEKKFVHKA